MIHDGRWTAEYDEDFVVFLIGARLNRTRRLLKMIPVARAMSRMQREIAEHPDIGCLHIENYGTVRPVSVQYWKSFELLERFARSSEWSHLAAWRDFNRLVRDSGDIGIWHETYKVAAGQFETMYGNMPRMGMAAAGRHVSVEHQSTAAVRISARHDDEAPVPGY